MKFRSITNKLVTLNSNFYFSILCTFRDEVLIEKALERNMILIVIFSLKNLCQPEPKAEIVLQHYVPTYIKNPCGYPKLQYVVILWQVRHF